jgi:hypothetical protein
MLFGIIAEDRSDAETLKVILRRLLDRHRSRSKFSLKGYHGWAQMFRKGISQLKLFAAQGCQKIVICFDADGPTDKGRVRRQKIDRELIKPSKVSIPCCAVVPVQELEAWVLADLAAVSKIMPSWRPTSSFPEPERIVNPKERLEKLSRDPKTRYQRYVPSIHNEKVAEFLDLEVVEDKCPSFARLVAFVRKGTANDSRGRRRT